MLFFFAFYSIIELGKTEKWVMRVKKNKIKIIILILIIVMNLFSSTSYGVAGIIQGIEDSSGDNRLNNAGRGITQVILGIVQAGAAGIAIIMIIVIATKYMIAAPTERADLKQHAFVYLFGALLLFAGAGIIELIEQFVLGVIQR